jgi:sigma-B regulation protein RsbU (phosphoserine phosphatase)
MNAVSPSLVHELRPKILERRARLQSAARAVSADYVNDLLAEIDATLQRIEDGSFGLCETCHDTIEQDRLERNPLLRFCLDHLTGAELRAHEQDLELATRIQTNLLPANDVSAGNWITHYRYQAAGVVSGDYCEVLPRGGDSLFFAVGDVAGKGVAASLLMAHLSAIFRSLLSLDLPLAEMISRANRLFCESTPATHYATLAAGRATGDGLELCSAGHCRPLLLRRGAEEWIDSTGLPLGLFCDGRYATRQVLLDAGESLVLYSDGITEAQDAAGNPFEEDGLKRSFAGHSEKDAASLAEGVVRDVARFCGARPQQDDMTLLVVRRR